MANVELGVFEDDPRSIAGAAALDLLDAETGGTHKIPEKDNWAAEDLFVDNDPWNSDPRVVATRAAIRDERTWDSYRQSGAWLMRPGVEVDLSQPTQ